MRRSFLAYLKCVDCENNDLEITFSQDRDCDIYSGILSCCNCGSKYPIYRSVPILISNAIIRYFLPEEIQQFLDEHHVSFPRDALPNNLAKIAHDSYRFWAIQWAGLEPYLEFQKDNYYFCEEAFRTFIPIAKNEYKNKDILVAGTGLGIEIPHLLNSSCRNVLAIDISPSIFSVQEKYKNDSRVCCVLADIMKLPFKNQFDIVLSQRVMSNIPDPSRGTKQLLAVLKENGVFAATYLSRENNRFMRTIVEPLKKIFLPHLSLKALYCFSCILASICFVGFKVYAFLYRCLPECFRRYVSSKEWLMYASFDFHWLWKATVFDVLHTSVNQFFSQGEIRALFSDYQKILIVNPIKTCWCVRVENK